MRERWQCDCDWCRAFNDLARPTEYGVSGYVVVPKTQPARATSSPRVAAPEGLWSVEVGEPGSGPWDRITIEYGPQPNSSFVVATVNKLDPRGLALARQLVNDANLAARAPFSGEPAPCPCKCHTSDCGLSAETCGPCCAPVKPPQVAPPDR